MLLVAPRLQPFALSTTVPLVARHHGRRDGLARATCRPARSWVGFALAGVGNGLIDVYLNVAGAAGRSPRRTGPSCNGCTRRTRSAASPGRSSPARSVRPGLRLPRRARLRRPSRSQVIGAVWTRATVPRERQRRGRRDAVLDLRAVPDRRSSWSRRSIVLVLVPDRGIDGRLVGPVPARSSSARPRASPRWRSSRSRGSMLPRTALRRAASCSALGRRTTILVAGVGSLIGGTIAVAADQVFVVALGFLVLGFTLSAAVPAAFGLAGEVGRGSHERDRRRHDGRLHRVHLEPAAARLGRAELQPPRRDGRDRHRDARHHRRRPAGPARRSRLIATGYSARFT